VRIPVIITLAFGLALGPGSLAPVVPAQQPTFRTAVDVVAVDVQVVDAEGRPVPRIGADRFDVEIGGRRRRVVSAEFVDLSAAAGSAAPDAGRTLVLAIDHSSFEVGTARAAAEAAARFVDGLSSADRVGLYVYPNGPRVDPTRDRATIRARLGGVFGTRQPLRSQYNLKPSEIVDISAQSAIFTGISAAARGRAALQEAANAPDNPIAVVQVRECPDEPECASRIFAEASALALRLESQAATSLGGLDHLVQALGQLPGRKGVVLLSAGVVVSDRPGARPDVGDLAHAMGQAAARANVSIYTIHIDTSFSGTYSAARRRASGDQRDRDRAMLARWLEAYSNGAGGTLINVPVGGGDFAFERVLRETSGYYLLGVEPADADRDGRARSLRVRVDGRGLTVRSRQWVVVPPGPETPGTPQQGTNRHVGVGGAADPRERLVRDCLTSSVCAG
jgi:VWFA-related protein